MACNTHVTLITQEAEAGLKLNTHLEIMQGVLGKPNLACTAEPVHDYKSLSAQ